MIGSYRSLLHFENVILKPLRVDVFENLNYLVCGIILNIAAFHHHHASWVEV